MEPTVRLDDLITLVKTMTPEDSALERLTNAVRVAENLGELSDHLVGHFVDQARRTGASWTDIGQSIGVTKQAAQKRFVPRADDSADASIFARFTPRARAVLTRAVDHARAAGNAPVECEHLLLGLLDEPNGLAVRAMVAQGTDLDAVRAATLAALAPPAETVPPHIPFSGRSKKLLQLTARESVRLGHNYIGTEHILFALLGDDTIPAGRLLAEHDVSADAAREWVLAELATLQV